MKITKVTVINLFGIFEHVIDMKPSGITIIIGENGLGKTIMLEMLEAFFNGKYSYLNNVVFDTLSIEFDDHVTWVIKKEIGPENLPFLELQQLTGDTTMTCKLTSPHNKEIHMMANNIARMNDSIRKINPNTWQDRRTGELLKASDVISNYTQIWSPHHADMMLSKLDYELHSNLPYLNEIRNEPPPWFFERHGHINVSLIKTQRLLAIDTSDQKHTYTVEKYSTEISKLVKTKLAESTELSSKLDRTYPNRLVNRLSNTSDVSEEYLYGQLGKLEKKRELLDEVGLIEIDKDTIPAFSLKDSQMVVKDVLLLYVEDSFAKLQIFDEISTKIELLLSIVNKRFKHKRLFIERERGFILKSTVLKDTENNFQNIPVTKLSSGEQNELVLFYELLFKTSKNSLILIDEPEISLHITWQNTFIEDLREINKLNEVDILIATHSPDIISNNWDMKIELKGVE